MRVAIYGANGSLGRRVVSRVSIAKSTCVLVGRDRERLQDAVSLAPNSTVVVATVDDPVALAAAIESCDVIVNCAPSSLTTLPLVRAAIAAGVHYVDGAGEQHVVRHLFEEIAPAAEQSKSAVVTAMGFDYAIGDCLAHIAAGAVNPVDEVIVAYAIEGPDVTGNSAEAATSGRRPEWVYRDGKWRPVPFEFDHATFDFGEPIGRRQMSRYGSAEVITVPRHSDVRTVRTLITSTSLCPYPALLPLFPVLRPLAGLVLRTPARALLHLRRRRDGEPAGSASAVQRHFTVVAEARSVDGRVYRAQASGGDFHEVTAALLVLGATWLARGHDPGMFSPATAFNPREVLSGIIPDGVNWSESGT